MRLTLFFSLLTSVLLTSCASVGEVPSFSYSEWQPYPGVPIQWRREIETVNSGEAIAKINLWLKSDAPSTLELKGMVRGTMVVHTDDDRTDIAGDAPDESLRGGCEIGNEFHVELDPSGTVAIPLRGTFRPAWHVIRNIRVEITSVTKR